MGAPVGVSQDLQQFTRFRPNQEGDGLSMHVCAAITNIIRATTSASVGTGLGSPSGAFASVQLNLTDPAGLTAAGTKSPFQLITPIFDLIASAFVRYKVKKLIFHYEPQAAATTGERLVFAFANDPLHPVMWNATPPTNSALLGLSDSIAFMPWRAWSMDVSHRLGDTEFYTFSDASTSVTEFVERFSDFGVISCITDTLSAGSNLVCGILYAEMEIELREFCPITVTRPASLRLLSDKAARHADERSHVQEAKRPEAAKVDTCGSTSESSEQEIARLREEVKGLQAAA